MVSLRVSRAFSAHWQHQWCRQFLCEGQAARKSVRHQPGTVMQRNMSRVIPPNTVSRKRE